MKFKLGQKIIDKIRGKKKENSLIKYIGNNNRLIIHKQDGTIKNNPINYDGLKIEFNGDNSTVELFEPIKFINCHFNVGNNNKITIKETTGKIIDFKIPYQMSDNSILEIGKNFNCISCLCYMHDEASNNITIGDDTLFSFEIILWPSDGHTIYDMDTKEVLNKSKTGIQIGSHVWVGMQANIMKNTKIPNNTIIGAKSLVNKYFEKENTILAGIPARIIKTNISWEECSIDSYIKKRGGVRNFIKKLCLSFVNIRLYVLYYDKIFLQKLKNQTRVNK